LEGRAVISQDPGHGQVPESENGGTPGEEGPDICEQVLAEIQAKQSGRHNWLKNLLILLISLVVFFKLGLFESGIEDLLIIVAVLFIHEGGHLLGMRLFGYKNVQMFFIPFLGAAVSGRSENVPTYKKAIVYLLGPLPGILLGSAFGILYMTTNSSFFLKVTAMFLLINVFNLLPFFPLDGGRFFQEVVFSRNRYVELVFRVLASLALVGFGAAIGAWLISALGLLGLLTARIPFKVARIANELSGLAQAPRAETTVTAVTSTESAEAIPPEIAAQIIERVRRDISDKLSIKVLASYTQSVWERMHQRPPRTAATLGLLGVYVLCFLLPLMAVVAAVVITVARGQHFTDRKIGVYEKPDGSKGRKEQFYAFGRLNAEMELHPKLPLYHGRSVYYKGNKRLWKEGNWHYGKWDGQWKTYDRGGNLIRVTIFDKGKFVACKELERDTWVERDINDLSDSVRQSYLAHPYEAPLGPQAGEDARPTGSADANDAVEEEDTQ
jgi:Zn-dependent protease